MMILSSKLPIRFGNLLNFTSIEILNFHYLKFIPFSNFNYSQSGKIHTTNLNFSTSNVYKYLHHEFRLNDPNTAQELIDHFNPEERALLLKLLSEQEKASERHDKKLIADRPNRSQIEQLFIVNTIPFIGFGILDNMIMILAGEYIDQSLGVFFSISTMAAAALGNIISDVAGVGLAHYVEIMVTKMGFKSPELSSKQLESKSARLTVNIARAFGLVIGCLIGMFPLLFFKTVPKKDESSS